MARSIRKGTIGFDFEVSFTEWTEGGLLRHPVLEGVREDKLATEVKREREQ